MKTLSFIIPVYNEKKRIKYCFKALKSFKFPKNIELREIIFVNDGSKDNTLLEIQNNTQELANKTGSKVIIVSYKKNKGKGYAVKKGMLKSSSDYSLFFDVDMSTPLNQLKKFVPFMLKDNDVIIGTRKSLKSTVVIQQPVYRQLLGKVFTLFSNIVLNTKVTDFTCGFKAFSKRSTKDVFLKSKINRWGYDSEILFLASKLNYNIIEIPVIWSDVRGSKVNVFKSVFSSLNDLYLIRKNYLLNKYHLNKKCSKQVQKIKQIAY